MTVRDFLSWVKFINACSSKDTTTFLHPSQAYFHGAFLVFLDALGIVNSQGTSNARELCSQFLSRQLEEIPGVANGSSDHEDITVEAMQTEDNEMFIVDGFSIRRGMSLRQMTCIKICILMRFNISTYRVSIGCGKYLEMLF